MTQLKLYVYDLETYSTVFLFTGKFLGSKQIDTFEISKRVNQRDALLAHLSWLQNSSVHMVGYNNIGFDYPILHELLNNPYTFDATTAWLKCQDIFKNQSYGAFHLPARDRIIPQIDIMKVNHFDNPMKRTRLKDLQFAMRSESVEDLPFDPHSDLTSEEIDRLIEYNLHDVTETEKFVNKCIHLINMRQELLDHGVITGDVLNYSDVKIGTEYLIKKIGRSKCFVSGSKPRQTPRVSIDFRDIILPKISFRSEKFDKVREWFASQTIWLTKQDEKPKLEIELGGLQFHFGLGGVHASVENKYFESNATHVIKDIDVSGMYVAVAIANGFFPEHLGKEFIQAYKQLQADRKQYPKGTTMNSVLKLAGNGVYGNSNNEWSCFFDPKYTFSVTVNGQLQLAQLVEFLIDIPRLHLIQANTDGITALVPRELVPFFDMWKAEWENMTGLKLEEVEYSRMWIRDVNSYLAECSE